MRQLHPLDPRKICIYLIGPLSVTGPKGENLTPRNQKSKALLAMLALAPRGSRSRVWLRDKLWSDRGEEQASASLRQALLDIRKSLGPNHRDILHSEKYSITLDLVRVRVDVIELVEQLDDDDGRIAAHGDVKAEHFLEGFDICDPEFESWLTLERQIWSQRFDDETARADDPVSGFAERPVSRPVPRATPLLQRPQPAGEARAWAVGTQVASGDQQDAALLDGRVSQHLQQMGQVPLMRLQPGQTPPDPAAGPFVPIVVRTSELEQGAQVRLSLELVTGDTGISIWSAHQSFDRAAIRAPGHAVLEGMVARAGIEISRHLRTTGHPEIELAGELIECIYRIFDLSAPELDRAEAGLARILKDQPRAKAYAWMAFAKSFRIGQRFAPDAAAQIEEAQFYAARALEEDEFDPLVLSLAAHIHSYLFSEFDHAAALFERALKIDPEQAIGWDLYATMHAYTGENDTARSMARWGQHLGAHTPMSYYYDTTRCMAAALGGDHAAAIASGERALAQRPQFNSILRYLISSHAHLGNTAEVSALRDKLLLLEPDFNTGVLRDAGYPGLSTDGGRHFLAGLRKAGLGRKT